MSKPMTLAKPARRAVSIAATTPPAGPERMASLPWNRLAAVSPPDDCMNIRRGRLSPGSACGLATLSREGRGFACGAFGA